MAATDITLANTLKASTGYGKEEGQSGEAITAGQQVYRDAATGKYFKGICTSANPAACRGVALNSCPGADQPLEVMNSGLITNVSSLVQGELYVVSDTTAGALMKYSDIGAGEFVTVVGIAQSTTTIQIQLFRGGVAHS